MKSRVLTTITVAAALAASACSQTPSDTSSLPATSDLQRIIDDRVQSGRSTGIVAGVVLPDGTTRVAGSGDDGGRRLDGDSVFEIGSITKTFTATLLAVMVHNDEVNLDDPVASLLPEGTSVPSRDGRQITLEDLATHTSGLPRNPANLDPTILTIPTPTTPSRSSTTSSAATSSPRTPARTSSTPTSVAPCSVTRSRSTPACRSRTSFGHGSSSRWT